MVEDSQQVCENVALIHRMKFRLTIRAFVFVMLSCTLQAQTGWKRYKNERWGFCLAYPDGWQTDEGVNKAGIAIFPPQQRPSGLESEISVGALYNARSEADSSKFETLEEASTGEQDVLREQSATDITVFEKRNVTVRGMPALLTKLQYKEAISGIVWIDEEISFRSSDEIRYSFELKCRPNEVTELEPIFNVITYNTFRIDCVYKHAELPKSTK